MAIEQRRWVIVGSLILLVLLLGAELLFVAPSALQAWHPYDYWQYAQMGHAVLEGRDPLGAGRYYPLPTILWIFVPLALLPDWFRFIWILAPFVFILVLFRQQGFLLFAFTPLWLVVSDAMLDGWLLLPMAWVLKNRPILAGIGAVALLVKPQLAILTVGYMLLRWFGERDWKNLGTFLGGLTVFVLPAFMLSPTWWVRFLQFLPMRANETLTVLPQMTSSLWSWWWLGGVGLLLGLLILVLAAIFVWSAIRRPENRGSIAQCLNMLLMPVLFGSNLITLVPALQNRRQIVIVVLISFVGFLLDRVIGNFGGGYVLIPLTILYFQMTGSRV